MWDPKNQDFDQKIFPSNFCLQKIEKKYFWFWVSGVCVCCDGVNLRWEMGIFDLKCMYQFLHDFWCFGGFRWVFWSVHNVQCSKVQNSFDNRFIGHFHNLNMGVRHHIRAAKIWSYTRMRPQKPGFWPKNFSQQFLPTKNRKKIFLILGLRSLCVLWWGQFALRNGYFWPKMHVSVFTWFLVFLGF